MREYQDDDPKYVAASIEAACALGGSWQCNPVSVGDYLWNILGLRASACGYRTLALTAWNARDKLEDIRHNKSILIERATNADEQAKKLKSEIDLPTKAQGCRELAIKVMWDQFRTIYVEVETMPRVMGLIAYARNAENVASVPTCYLNDAPLMRYSRDIVETIAGALADYRISRDRWRVN